jgi:GT2 family glycosyltransferase
MGVLICSYRRPRELSQLLLALSKQTLLPDDVFVVVRQDDELTRNVVSEHQREQSRYRLRMIETTEPGLVNARNAGLDACQTDILAMTDDDTIPHADWLSRIDAHFAADPTLGGLGGRDWCFVNGNFDERRQSVVGRLLWYGRMIGNHHLGYGAPREVEFIKGANMSYRLSAIQGLRFDTRLRGSGAQPLEDTAFPVAVRLKGWKIVYDPLVAVDHYVGPRKEPRLYVGVSDIMDPEGYFNLGHNEVIAIWGLLSPVGRAAYITWSFFIGGSISPGLLQAIRFMPRFGAASWQRFWALQRGKVAAYRLIWSDDRATIRPAGVEDKPAGRRRASYSRGGG